MLKFSFGNSKIILLAKYLNLPNKAVASFDLPAGFTCPAALLCQSYSNRETGKITDGKSLQFRCYAASSEGAFPSVRRLRWHNFDLLAKKSISQMIAEIEVSLPIMVKVIRIHSSGDYFSKNYFQAWRMVAVTHPEIMFFGYSKILEYVQHSISNPLPNFKLVYSIGGKYDNLLTDEIPSIRVVENKEIAHSLNLSVSCDIHPADDYDYIINGKSFAIALHGTQPAGKYKGYSNKDKH